MATIQVRIDDNTKASVDSLFSSLGLDTSTAVRVFLMAALENNGLPFPVKRLTPKEDLLEAIEDTRLRRNLSGPFKTAEAAVASMLED
ncbi:MAG: type II toxin-antitoxin system RelB/DinJ family antitoxin [Coriobacteriia bacterium]|jgi:DNA-damage-inducible protein J|nr:type II toxin-antitoxin system RelB/DinJ family antitoxin [Coriobacteriia bacterium]MDR2714905.1 type II toxin-antitoxin system RelB/DinJ family antitoxin [Coriobacteriales bacterium]